MSCFAIFSLYPVTAVLFFCIPKSSRKVCAAEEGPCVCLHREEGQEEEVWSVMCPRGSREALQLEGELQHRQSTLALHIAVWSGDTWRRFNKRSPESSIATAAQRCIDQGESPCWLAAFQCPQCTLLGGSGAAFCRFSQFQQSLCCMFPSDQCRPSVWSSLSQTSASTACQGICLWQSWGSF